MTEPILPPYQPPKVQTQLLVLMAGQQMPLIINPEDEVTKDGIDGRLDFTDIVIQLTSTVGWVEVWQSQELDDGGSARLGVRVMGRNVALLTQAFVYPPADDMVQA